MPPQSLSIQMGNVEFDDRIANLKEPRQQNLREFDQQPQTLGVHYHPGWE